MAHIVKQRYTVWLGANGRRTKPNTPGATKETRESAKWYAIGIPGSGARRVPLSKNKAVAQRMLDDMVRRADLGAVGIPDMDARRRPLSEYLTEFLADVRLGLASRSKGKKRRPSADGVALLETRTRAVLTGAGLVTPADLDDASPAKIASYLNRQVATETISHQTANFYLSSIRRFAWWLSRRNLAIRSDLLDSIPGFDPANNRVHLRREITPEELDSLLTATRTGATRRHLTGEDRYCLYLTAFATGLRAKELSRLTPASFHLDTIPPSISLPGKHSKNGKPVTQPIPLAAADQLRSWLASKKPATPVWPGPWARDRGAGKMLQHDLKAAGVEYRIDSPNGPLFADFHALRHTFISALASAGVGPKELQTLARHSSPSLTLGIYTHTRASTLADSVERLAVPGTPGAAPELAKGGASGEVMAPLTPEQLLSAAALGWVLASHFLTVRLTGSCADRRRLATIGNETAPA